MNAAFVVDVDLMRENRLCIQVPIAVADVRTSFVGLDAPLERLMSPYLPW